MPPASASRTSANLRFDSLPEVRTYSVADIFAGGFTPPQRELERARTAGSEALDLNRERERCKAVEARIRAKSLASMSAAAEAVRSRGTAPSAPERKGQLSTSDRLLLALAEEDDG